MLTDFDSLELKSNRIANPAHFTMTALPASFQHANKAAIAAALAENSESIGADVEPGEIQEVDMQAQADDIRTVFSHPTSFNVKVSNRIDSPL